MLLVDTTVDNVKTVVMRLDKARCRKHKHVLKYIFDGFCVPITPLRNLWAH